MSNIFCLVQHSRTFRKHDRRISNDLLNKSIKVRSSRFFYHDKNTHKAVNEKLLAS